MLQNIEVFTTSTNNYLLIHKNGCSQVKEHLYKNFLSVEHNNFFPQNKKINWTVLRDPYDRFISGLTYDILLQFGNLNNLDNIINESVLESFIYQKINLKTRKNGNVNHTIAQWTYLFSQPINFIVELKDLNKFLDIHFKIRSNLFKNETLFEHKKIVSNFIEKNKILKKLIKSYLASDYYYIKQAMNNNLFWKWQNGKMF